MKRSTRSLTSMVDMPARATSSSISKTDASSRPDMRMSASSSGVFTISGGRRIHEGHGCGGKLSLHDLGEGERGIGFGQHADLHPELGLRVDRPAHHRAGPANFLVQPFIDFNDAHRQFSVKYTKRIYFV